MNKLQLILCCGLLTFIAGNAIRAQAPALPTKANLAHTLVANHAFTGSQGLDTIARFGNIATDFTLQVVARVNAASGRGMDIEARRSDVKGFRLALDAANLKYAAPIASTNKLTTAAAGSQHTIRVAVSNNNAHIYQDGAYIETRPLTDIGEIVNGVEQANASGAVDPVNLAAGWAGTPSNNSGKPSDYGWAYTGNTSTTLFNTANSSSGVRYLDINAASGGNVQTLDGVAYAGRIMYIRWDGSATQNTVYSYPVTLEANTSYVFSMLHSYISNTTGGRSLTVGVGKTTDVADRIGSKTFTTTGTRVLVRESFAFKSQEAGQYYLTINGNWALFSIGELSVNKFDVLPRFVFGKNATTGTLNGQIVSATYQDGAWAPDGEQTHTRSTVTLTGTVENLPACFHTDYIVPGKTDVHLTAENTPLINSTIALNANNAWLFFDNIKPSVVIANWLNKVTVNGAAAVNGVNVRVAVYKNGTAIIPNGNTTDNAALEVFKQPDMQGGSTSLAIQAYHNNLGEYNNAIRSFKLKRGYMATLATNADGTGFSRVFIANDSDLVVNTMPAGLDTTVSFIRVFRWNWPSKKGKAGGGNPLKLTNVTWYYDWNIGGATSVDYDYAAIRQTAWWPGWNDINNKPNINHLLGPNEPDRPDQANMSVDAAIALWPDMMKSGLRIGSPSPANPGSNWITDFMTKADQLNYRVDYVAIHCYWANKTPQQWYNDLRTIYNRVKRPLWITEWNNGANWTNETWPAEQSAQFQKQLNDLKGILQVLDTASFVERYAEYDWVENKRALVLADTLTPAGKYYAANKSDFAYNPAMAHHHTWKLATPLLSYAITDTNYFRVNISWPEPNGETASRYVLERKIDGRDADFAEAANYTDYTPGASMAFMDSVYTKATYRLKILGTDGVSQTYSAILEVLGDPAPLPPPVSGTIVSATKLRIHWTAAADARSYNIRRSLNQAGPFELIGGRSKALTLLDENLAPNTTYYYVVTSLNSAGESAPSNVLAITTPPLAAPSMVVNPRVASGDSRVTLGWDFQYDARYTILRSVNQNGPFDTVANNLQTLRYIDSNRVNNTTYYYKLLAFNDVGYSSETSLFAAQPRLGQHQHIDFNEQAGALAKDNWGGFNGTLQNGATWAAGKDSATGGVLLNRNLTSHIQLEPGVVSELNDFTIATWFKMPAGHLNNGRVFDFGNGTGTWMALVPRVSTANGTSVRYKITGAAGTYDRYIAYELPLDQWVHLVISQQGSNFKMYVNGTLQYTDDQASVKPSDMGITTQNYLGRSQWSADPYNNQEYDDFRIYNRALGDGDVYALYSGSPLPVVLSAFDGKATREGNLLYWTTASEVNSDKFVVERSHNSTSGFQALGSIKAKGNSSAGQAYRFLDGTPLAGVSFYRLRQMNFDGSYHYSRVIKLYAGKTTAVKVYPNPVTSIAVIELPAVVNGAVTLRVTNAAGQLVFSRLQQPTGQRVQLNLSAAPPGIYHVQVVAGSVVQSFSVVKK